MQTFALPPWRRLGSGCAFRGRGEHPDTMETALAHRPKKSWLILHGQNSSNYRGRVNGTVCRRGGVLRPRIQESN